LHDISKKMAGNLQKRATLYEIYHDPHVSNNYAIPEKLMSWQTMQQVFPKSSIDKLRISDQKHVCFGDFAIAELRHVRTQHNVRRRTGKYKISDPGAD
jgi:hypothetical protein